MKKPLKFLLILIILTGVIYPLIVHSLGNIFFWYEAQGSIIKNAGSELIATSPDSNIYFYARPSAGNYNTIPSGASNLSPTSRILKEKTDSLRILYRKINFLSDTTEVPEDAIFASGSGLDNEISVRNAMLQVDRIAKARGMNDEDKQKIYNIIHSLTQKETFGFIGEERVNVLKLNIALDGK